MSARRIAVPLLVVVASVALLLAVLAGYVRHAAVDADQFANRATVALQDESVRTLVADEVTDEIVLRKQADLLAVRPLIHSVVSSVVGGRAFGNAFRAAVRDVHRAVFVRDQDTVTLTVSDVGTIVAAGLEVVRPDVARQVDVSRPVTVFGREIGSASADAARFARTVRLLAWALALLAVLAAAAAIRLSTDRRRTVVHLGAGMAAAGVVLVVGLGVARSVVAGGADGPEARDAVRAVWDAFLGDLHTAGWVIAASGAVVAAAAASLIRPVEIGAPLRRAAAWATREPASTRIQVVRGVALVAAGLVVLLARDAVLRLAFTLAGLYLVYAGVSAILWVIYEPPARRPAAAAAPPSRGRGRALVAAGVAALLVVAAAGTFVGTGGASTPAPAAGPCNGHEELCSRRLPDLALASTHNSMSAPLPGWFSSAQDRGIPEQLRDGIRGLLIDTHYADRLPDGRLRTDAGSLAELKRNAQRDGVSPAAVDAALRVRGRLGFRGEGERGMYLCHSFCELGGTKLEEVLRSLHDFLVANPGEVMVVVNQDYVTPADFVGAVREAGLEDLVYQGPTTGRWPTLREMIDRDERLVFLAENEAGAAPWYHLAYDAITEETPYAFSRTRQLTDPATVDATCRPNRGPDDAPMFLVNHWVTTDPIPLPSQASTVNAYEPLMQRLNACRRVRDHLPNLVAVNFYLRGDLFRAVDTLNGVGGP